MLIFGCGGGDLAPPVPGAITVTTRTTGSAADPDGYTVRLDDRQAVVIGSDDTRTFPVEAGDHEVELGSLAANCRVDGEARQGVTVAEGDTVSAAFQVICSEVVGALEVVTTTTGEAPDADGYTVRIDDGTPVAIESNGSLTFPVAAGEHEVELGGLADQCRVEGESRRAVTVPQDETVSIAFEVTCTATVGELRVVTATSGTAPDPDGYTVQVDEGSEQPIEVDGTLLVPGLPPGPHSVLLGGVAGNCVVEGENPRAVEIVAGAEATVEFTVTCSSGVRQWTAMASGSMADLPDVWGSSGTDVFAVGELFTDDDFELFSDILHYDGTGWTRQFRERDVSLRGVWGSSGTDVYAVGFDFFSSEAVVLHYDGASWSKVPGLVAEGFEQFALLSVWGSSASDVFAVGSTFEGGFERALIFHFDGSAWQRLFVNGPLDPALVDVWGSSSTDVYAVGRDDFADVFTGVILRYDGSTWTPVLEAEGLGLTSVWGSSATDVFAAGFQVEGTEEEPEVVGVIHHFDGTSWSRMAIPRTGILHGVWGSSAGDVFAVGEDGVILHYDGTEWTETSPTSEILLGVWGSSAADVFAVGNRGTILHGTP